MSANFFKIGEKVSWKSSNYRPDYNDYIIYTGVIIDTNNGKYVIQFESDFQQYYGIPGLYTGFNDDSNLFIYKTPLTREESLLLKIKTLWNKSKYVQEHPHQAY